MAGVENPLSADQSRDVESSEGLVLDREPHLGGGASPQLLMGDVEAALAALKGSAVFDREPQTVDAMERLMAAQAATNATIAELRVELRAAIDQGAPAEFAEAAVRSVVARLTEAPTNLHQSTPGLNPPTPR
jgi:hypothetical protein